MSEQKGQQKDPDLQKVEEKFAQSQPLLHHEGAGFLLSKLSILASESSSVSNSPLFSFLLRSACHKQPSIADPCLHTLGQLVLEGKIDPTEAINALLGIFSSISTASSLDCALRVLVDLIEYRLTKSPGFVSSRDPLLAVVEVRGPTVLGAMLEQIIQCPPELLMRIFNGVIEHILLQEAENSSVSYALHSHLIERITGDLSPALADQLTSFLVSMLRVYHIHTPQARAYTLHCVDQLVSLVETNTSLAPTLSAVLLEHAAQCVALNAPLYPFIDRLDETVRLAGKISPAFSQTLALAVAFLLHSCAASNVTDVRALLTLLSALFDRCGKNANRLVLSVCTPPVLAVCSSPVMQSVRVQSSGLLDKMRKLLPFVSDSTLNPIEQIRVKYSHLLVVIRMQAALEGAAEHTQSRLEEALAAVHRLPEGHPLQSAALLCFFLPYFLFHVSFEIRKLALQLIAELIVRSPAEAFNLLPALLHQLASEISAELQITLMYTIAAMAKYEPAVPTLFRALKTFLAMPELASVALRLLARLWQEQDRIFPRLHAALIDTNKQLEAAKTSSPETDELRLSLAITLRDICHLRPSRAPEVLGILSSLVRSEAAGSAVSVSAGIQALEYLCRADVLDWRTAWSVVGKGRLASDESLPPVIIAALYGFFATGARDLDERDLATDEAREEAEDPTSGLHLIYSVLARMWAGTAHTDPRVRTASYRSLREYFNHIGSVSLSAVLPHLQAATQIPARCAALLGESHNDARKDAVALVKKIVELEIGQRKGVGGAAETAHAIKPVARTVLASIKQYLEKLNETKTVRPTLRGAIAVAMLFVPHAVEGGSRKKANGRPQSVSLLWYRRLLLDLIGDITATDSQTRLQLINGWAQFFDRLVDAVLSDYNDDPKEAEAELQPLLKELLEKVKSVSPAQSENAVMCLGALARALPPSATASHELLLRELETHVASASAPHYVRSAAAVAFALALCTRKRSAALVSVTALTEALCQLLKTGLSTSGIAWAASTAAGMLSNALYSGIISLQEQFASKLHAQLEAALLQYLVASRSLFGFFASHAGGQMTLATNPSPDTDGVVGAVLALGQLCHAYEVSKNTSALLRLYQFLKDKDFAEVGTVSAADPAVISACISVYPTVLVRLYRTRSLDSVTINGHLAELREEREHPDTPAAVRDVLDIALASLYYALSREGFAFSDAKVVAEFARKLSQQLTSGSIESRLTAPIAISHLLGSFLLVPYPFTSQLPPWQQGLSLMFALDAKMSVPSQELVQALMTRSEARDEDARVGRLCVSVLGALLTPHDDISAVQDAPSSLSHLPETSVVRALFEVVHQAVLAPVAGSSSGRREEGALKVLAHLSNTKRLPVVNWPPLLDKAVKTQHIAMEMKLDALYLAIHNAHIPPLVTWLMSVLDGTRFDPLDLPIKSMLLGNLHRVVSPSLGEAHSKQLLRDLVASRWNDYTHEIRITLLNALDHLLASATHNATSQHVIADVHTIVLSLLHSPHASMDVCESNGIEANSLALYQHLASCLAHLPPAVLEGKLKVSLHNTDLASEMDVRNVIVRSELVRMKKLPLTALWPCRSWCLAQLPTPITYQVHEQVLAPVRSLSAAERRQWLIDTVDALGLCASPVVGLQFVDRMLQLWLAPELYPHFLSGSEGSTLVAYSLPTVLEQHEMREGQQTAFDHVFSLMAIPSAQPVVSQLASFLVASKTLHKAGTRWTQVGSIIARNERK